MEDSRLVRGFDRHGIAQGSDAFNGYFDCIAIDQGAYPGFPFGANITKAMQKVYLPGMYRWEAYEMRARVIAT